ncbi:carbohydrate kinase [Cohnella kolymensis]|uniref:Carbohydrate kinase n=1 Tax=Cohnella kolymensis TaxID=1590652 RepID=A0ABR5A2C0_9BACL|nr:carbohydrate kinase [Cohnella kolymensis]
MIVAGHICLDVIPLIQEKQGGMDALLIPGKLVDVGPALTATGGAVSNTGLALHRLGIATKLMGKVGDDLFGQAIIDALARYGDSLADGMIKSPGGVSSYSIVINPPNVDRIFLHCTGTNDTFAAAEVNPEALHGAKIFHFGYPPLMQLMYEKDGEELQTLLSRVKAQGLTVSLDMARPDPESVAGKADWRLILSKALPFVDVFMPSFEEILYMLQRDTFDSLVRSYQTTELVRFADSDLLNSLSQELLDMGAAIVALKLGEHGLYVRTTADPGRLAAMGFGAPQTAAQADWLGRELLIPCYEVKVAGTTGAGDCTIAGFLAGLLRGVPIEEVLHAAVAVGACNVEKADATSGVPSWEEVRSRMASGWAQKPIAAHFAGWEHDSNTGVYFSGRNRN